MRRPRGGRPRRPDVPANESGGWTFLPYVYKVELSRDVLLDASPELPFLLASGRFFLDVQLEEM